MIIGLLRHSLTKKNEDDLACGGLSDPHLSENGIKIVEEIKNKGLYSKDPGVLYASTLMRTRETLEIIYPGKEIIETALLNEQKLGVIESLTKENSFEYFSTHPSIIADTSYVPEGDAESYDMFFERVKRDFMILYKEFEEKGYEKVTICCHGNYFRALIVLFNMLSEELLTFDTTQVKNGCGVECKVERNGDSLDFELVAYLGGKDLDSISRSYDALYHKGGK